MPPHPSLAEQIGAALTTARGSRPKTEIALTAAVSPEYLIAVEKGKKNLTIERVQSLGVAYGVLFVVHAFSDVDAKSGACNVVSFPSPPRLSSRTA